MENMYFTLCEDFENMAQEHYRVYCEAKQEYDQSIHSNVSSSNILPAKKMLWAACSAVVFEAIAIEAYVNLLGSYLMGDRYIEQDRCKKQPTLDKLRMLCKDEIKKLYPANHMYEIMRNLFIKRDRIVHTKPCPHTFEIKPFNYTDIESNYSDYISAFSKEIGFLYEGLKEQMQSYSVLVQNINALLGKNMLEEIRDAPKNNMESMFRAMIKNSLNQNPPEA